MRKYKYLGVFKQIDGGLSADATRKSRKAMSSYSPIAHRIFGCNAVSVWLKYLFLHSLILSRLLYGAHTVVPKPKFVKTLQSVYMRVLRRKYGEVRHCRTQHTDLELRTMMQQPSIDCLLMRTRMRYLKGLLSNCPMALISLFHLKPNNIFLPWVKLIIDDMRWITHHSYAEDAWAMPDPESYPATWTQHILSNKWCNIVSRIFYVTSIADPPNAASNLVPPAHCLQNCDICGASFPTKRQYTMHVVRKHGKRSPHARYVDDTRTCPVCDNSYADRICVIHHLYYNKCGATLPRGQYRTIPDDLFDSLQAKDRALYRQADKLKYIASKIYSLFLKSNEYLELKLLYPQVTRSLLLQSLDLRLSVP